MKWPHWIQHRWGPWGPARRYLVRVGRRRVEVMGVQTRVCQECLMSQTRKEG